MPRTRRQDSPAPAFTTNQLLATLPPEEYADVRPYLEALYLPAGSVLSAANTVITAVYFPLTGTCGGSLSIRVGPKLNPR